MAFKDLRDFIDLLESKGELKRISMEVDPVLEITEISDRTLRAGGPALLFENPKGSKIPLLANLFGNTRRIALAMARSTLPMSSSVVWLAFRQPVLPFYTNYGCFPDIWRWLRDPMSPEIRQASYAADRLAPLG